MDCLRHFTKNAGYALRLGVSEAGFSSLIFFTPKVAGQNHAPYFIVETF